MKTLFGLFFAVSGLCSSIFSTFAQTSEQLYGGAASIQTNINTRGGITDSYSLIYLLPKDKVLNEVKMDLGNVGDTRIILGVSGLTAGQAWTTAKGSLVKAKVSTDIYCISGQGSFALVKDANLSIDIPTSKKLIERIHLSAGQAIHPLSEDHPSVITHGAGAPFNPYGFAPQIKTRLDHKDLSICAAALWLGEYPGFGPEGESTNYIKYTSIPEMFLGACLKKSDWSASIGADYLLTKPRMYGPYPLTSVIVPVNDRMDAFSTFAAATYRTSIGGRNLTLNAKGLFNAGQSHLNMFGGYAVYNYESSLLARYYCPVRTASVWAEALYGGKVVYGLFAGWLGNLGSGHAPLHESLIYYPNGMDNLVSAARLSASAKWSWKSITASAGYDFMVSFWGEGERMTDCVAGGPRHGVANHAITLSLSWTL